MESEGQSHIETWAKRPPP